MWRRLVWVITLAAGLYFLLEFLLPAQLPLWMSGERDPLSQRRDGMTQYGIAVDALAAATGATGPVPALADIPMWRGKPKNPLTRAMDPVTKFLIVVATMSFLLGPLNLLKRHVPTAIHRRPGWWESVVFLVFLALGIAAQSCHVDGREVVNLGERLYGTLFYGLMLGFGASSMALLAFYLVSAAHRAFRVSSLESGLMMATAVIILLGQVPLGDWLTRGAPDWMQLPSVAQWILTVPNTAVQRAVLLGACGGAFAAALRQWLGVGAKT